MTGSALMDFLIAVVGLILVVGLVFLAIDFLAPDERFKKIARWAVGGVALIVFLTAIKGVLFGGAGGLGTFGPIGLIEFAIGLLVVLVVVYIIYRVVDYLAPAFAAEIKYVIGAIALIAILVVAQRALFGGGLGVFPNKRTESVVPSIGAVMPPPAPIIRNGYCSHVAAPPTAHGAQRNHQA